MMIRPIGKKAILALALSATSCWTLGSVQADSNHFSRSELRGPWQAIAESELRLFELDIPDDGQATITMVVGPPTMVLKDTFLVDSMYVAYNGRVRVSAKQSETGMLIEILGSAYGRRYAGRMVAEVRFRGRPDADPTVFKAVFHSRAKHTYFERLSALLLAAQDNSKMPRPP